jgi:GTP-binding protein YchF
MLKAGIVGLPNIGKSTLFNAITQAGAVSANYPFCTIEPNVGVVDVPDERLQVLATIVHPQRIVPTSFQFVDIAGLVKGASKGEGLGNQFLAHIREVDAIIHVVRCFQDENVIHVAGAIDPLDDMRTIELELILADVETVEKRIERVKKNAKGGDKKGVLELDTLQKILHVLYEEKPARQAMLDDEQRALAKELHLITMKPVLYVANVSEADVADPKQNVFVAQVQQYAKQHGIEVVPISAQVEAEIAELAGEDKMAFIAELGLTEAGLHRLIRAAYTLLGLTTYFTAGVQEVRAWTIRTGMKAPQAAGVIHSDFERGFIRAEVVGYDDLVAAGSTVTARERGLMRLEGKEYVVADGDVVHFRFNV